MALDTTDELLNASKALKAWFENQEIDIPDQMVLCQFYVALGMDANRDTSSINDKITLMSMTVKKFAEVAKQLRHDKLGPPSN